MSAAPLIRARGLTKTYGRGDAAQTVLKGVDLDIQPGEFVAITGASGSGKSTLLHLLGLLDTPSKGTYRLNGRDVSTMRQVKRAQVRNQDIGFVFQAFYLLPRLTALQNVLLATTYANRPVPQSHARKLLDQVGLHAKAEARPTELSGGQQQRIAIARALVMDPKLILADEPTGNLDSTTSREIMAILERINRAGNTIILITHEPDIAARAQRTIKLADGRIV